MPLRAAVIVLLSGAVAGAQPAQTPRMAALRQWMVLAAQHTPGRVDAAVNEVREWEREALQFVRDDLHALRLFLCERCTAPAASRRPADELPEIVMRDGRADWVPHYSQAHLSDLGRLSRDIESAAFTDLLKRGALLHTDIALRAPPVMTWAPTAMYRPLARTVVHVADGQQYGVNEAVDHLEMARRLLDIVTPDPAQDRAASPARDRMVRQWYRATTAMLVQTRQIEANHSRAALAIFPEDPDLLVLAAAMHEALATPQYQTAVAVRSLGGSPAMEAERDELRRAEQLLRRAVKADATHAEARLRLGQVLGRMDRHEDALVELRAVTATGDLLLLYYAHLLTGREEDRLGRTAEARLAYERAAALFPEAQSPYLAMSELAMRSGDRPAAVRRLDEWWARSVSATGAEDPWTQYLPAAGRRGRSQLAEIAAAFPVRGQP